MLLWQCFCFSSLPQMELLSLSYTNNTWYDMHLASPFKNDYFYSHRSHITVHRIITIIADVNHLKSPMRALWTSKKIKTMGKTGHRDICVWLMFLHQCDGEKAGFIFCGWFSVTTKITYHDLIYITKRKGHVQLSLLISRSHQSWTANVNDCDRGSAVLKERQNKHERKEGKRTFPSP